MLAERAGGVKVATAEVKEVKKVATAEVKKVATAEVKEVQKVQEVEHDIR